MDQWIKYIVIARFVYFISGVPRGGWGSSIPPPPKFRRGEPADPNSQFGGKDIRNHLIRRRVSLIFKYSGTSD
jgi:hypothetical protein